MPIDGVLNKKHFYETSCRKCAAKASRRLLFNFGNQPKIMQEILLKIRYFERWSAKSLKEVNFIFSFEPVPSNGQDYKKTKAT